MVVCLLNVIKQTDYHISCLQNVLTWVATGICEFDQRKAAEIALGTVTLWLESNHSSVNHVIVCAYENADYEIYKDLMSTVYFPVSKNHSLDNYLKSNWSNYCVLNVKNIETSDESGQNLSGCQIYRSTESLGECKKRISGKVDFSQVTLTMEKMFVFLTLLYRSCIVYHYLEIT